jgi:hypothetical protein
MKKLLSLFVGAMLLIAPVATVIVIAPGCTMTQNRITYQTLYGIGKATHNAYQGYLDLVVAGKIPATSLERIGKIWDRYRVSYIAAVDAAKLNMNSPAPQDVIDLSNSVIAAVTAFNK